MQAKTLSAKIAKRKDLTDDLFILWLELENREDFTFAKAGQYCTIGLSDAEGNFVLDARGRPLRRAYSIASAPHEECIELFVELVPGGELTPLLHRIKVGDAVDLLPKAKGVFSFEPKYKNHIMVSTVTGVVPFISIIRDYMHRGESGHRFFVLQGASYMDEFAYYMELCKIVIEHRCRINLTYVPTVSRPAENRNNFWSGKKGRVNEILGAYILKWYSTRDISPADTLIYACGHPGMIEDVKNRLTPQGWKLKEERFWKE